MAALGSVAALAEYLGHEYWQFRDGAFYKELWRRNDLSANLDGLSPAQQNITKLALAAWSDVADIQFVFNSTGKILYISNTSEPFSVTLYNIHGGFGVAGEITDADVHIGLDTSGGGENSGVGSLYFQTSLKASGMALGLGLLGPYPTFDSGTYGVDNIFINDTWQWSVMSNNPQNSLGGATKTFVTTPQMADIYAIQEKYGPATHTRLGDTTYGFHNNAGPLYDFGTLSPAPAFTIYDNGGDDTLDASGFAMAQIIDLTPGNWSSIGGQINNIAIYYGVAIENAVGGTGNDVIMPYFGAKGSLTGGGGNDTFRGVENGLNSEDITDMNVGDRINFIDASLSTFHYRQFDTSLAYDHFSLNVSNNPVGHFIVSAGASGVDLTLAPHDLNLNDFNADGHSDIVWRHSSGTFTVWTVSGNALGNVVNTGDYGFRTIDNTWHIEGTADFYGDGAFDLFWRNDNGSFTIWDGTGAGYNESSYANATVGLEWEVAGFGDFNRDGRTDILWRHDNGTISPWLANGAGFASSGYFRQVAASAHIVGLGDFNGDGADDILWRSNAGTFTTWFASGAGFDENTYVDSSVDTTWQVAGIGDFNGDHLSDILWRNDNGAITVWQSGYGNHFFAGYSFASNGYFAQVGNDWHITAVGDFNDDGKADILWRNNNGTIDTWQSTGSGFTTDVLVDSTVGNDWTIVTHHFDTLALDPRSASNDFNGDGRSDILFGATGAVHASNYEWQMNGRSIASQGAIDLYDKSFTVQVVGDFDGDGRGDIVFENPNTGGVWEWRLNGATIVGQGAVDVADKTYHLLGAADFDGNGTDDLLWRNDAGFIYQWQMKLQASTAGSDTPAPVQLLDPHWHIVGAGDFDGDGKSDLLLRNVGGAASENGAFFLWQMNGNAIKDQGGIERPGTDWQTLGVGDFDGDGKADFAVRHVSNFQGGELPGAVWVYLMDGKAIKAQGAAGIADAAQFHLAGIGDYNGDGRDDILFRNDAGYFYSWDMDGTHIKSEGAIPWADPSQHVVTQHWEVA